MIDLCVKLLAAMGFLFILGQILPDLDPMEHPHDYY